MNRRQFEYESVILLCKWEELHFRLNEYGLQGWEAISIFDEPVDDGKGSHYYTVFFKREIVTNEQHSEQSTNTHK